MRHNHSIDRRPLATVAFRRRSAGIALLISGALALAPGAPGAAAAQSEAGATNAAPATAGADRDAAKAIRVEQAWIRWLPGGLPAGGYVTLTNGSDHSIVLVGAGSSDYDQVQLHQSITEGGLSKMVAVAHILIPAHSTLSFAAHGYHLMLMKARVSLSPGDRVPIELRFADGRSLIATFDVRAPADDPSNASHAAGMENMPGMSHTK